MKNTSQPRIVTAATRLAAIQKRKQAIFTELARLESRVHSLNEEHRNLNGEHTALVREMDKLSVGNLPSV